MRQKNNKVYIQIGTNDGNDEFNRKVKRNKPSMVILVEPNASLNESIEENYANIAVHIVNVAITSVPQGVVKLVIPDVKYRRNNYTSKHYSLLPMDDWGEKFENELIAYSTTFDELCSRFDIKHIDYLQVDTEGYDSEIIKSINFSKISIDQIKYEDWSFPESAFSRYGKKAKDYGINGMKQVEKLLTDLGYKLSRTKRDIVAIK